VDRCERDPEHAYAVNSVGTYNIAAVARTSGAKLIYVSTAGVFDGKKEGFYGEEDTPNPQNYYGHSKFLGELAVKNLKDYLIVRACWMMGGGPKKDQKFVAKIISQIRDPNVKEIKVVTDQYGSPTYAKDLVAAIKVLVSQGKTGIFHLANKGSVSRYDVAKFIMDYFKTSKKLIASDLASFGLDGKRAKNEALDSKVDLMRPWQEALGDYLKTEWSN